MKKILMFVIVMLISMAAFAGTTGVFDMVKGYITLENIFAVIGAVSIAMTGVPIPKEGTVLWKIYSVLKYLGGNFGFADHTNKK